MIQRNVLLSCSRGSRSRNNEETSGSHYPWHTVISQKNGFLSCNAAETSKLVLSSPLFSRIGCVLPVLLLCGFEHRKSVWRILCINGWPSNPVTFIVYPSLQNFVEIRYVGVEFKPAAGQICQIIWHVTCQHTRIEACTFRHTSVFMVACCAAFIVFRPPAWCHILEVSRGPFRSLCNPSSVV